MRWKDSVALQAPGIHLPFERDLRRLNGFWDYGPLGVELKRNIKQAWWDDMVAQHDETGSLPARRTFGMVGLDSAMLMNPKVWEARARRRLQRSDGR